MNSNSDPDAICSIACKRVLDKDFDEPSGVEVIPGTWRDANGNLVDELNTPSSETAMRDEVVKMKDRIDQVIALLKEAKEKNDALQFKTVTGSPEWHSHETVDDKIHEALALLGD